MQPNKNPRQDCMVGSLKKRVPKIFTKIVFIWLLLFSYIAWSFHANQTSPHIPFHSLPLQTPAFTDEIKVLIGANNFISEVTHNIFMNPNLTIL